MPSYSTETPIIEQYFRDHLCRIGTRPNQLVMGVADPENLKLMIEDGITYWNATAI